MRECLSIGFDVITPTNYAKYCEFLDDTRLSVVSSLFHPSLDVDKVSMLHLRNFIKNLISEISDISLIVFHHCEDHSEWKQSIRLFEGQENVKRYLDQLLTLPRASNGQPYVLRPIIATRGTSVVTNESISQMLNQRFSGSTYLTQQLRQLVPFTILPELNELLVSHYGTDVEKKYIKTNGSYLRLIEDYITVSQDKSVEELRNDEILLRLIKAVKDEMMLQIQLDVDATVEEQSDVLLAFLKKYPNLQGVVKS